MVDSDKVKTYYDNYTTRQLKAGVNDRHKSILKKLIETGMQPNDAVLEIGCGIGTQSSLLLSFLKKGSLTALDISHKSIEIANKTQSGYKQGHFIATDVVQWETEQKFNVIVLPDVLEHIPSISHLAIFKKLANLIENSGFILIHIPHPFYQEYVKTYKPEDLQIIDQALPLEHFVNMANKSNLHISYLKSYSIWHEPTEYQFIIMQKTEFAKEIKPIKIKPSIHKRIIEKIKLILSHG